MCRCFDVLLCCNVVGALFVGLFVSIAVCSVGFVSICCWFVCYVVNVLLCWCVVVLLCGRCVCLLCRCVDVLLFG